MFTWKKKKQKAPGRSPFFIILNMYQIHESWIYSHYMRLVHCKSVMFSHKMITAPNVLLVLCQKNSCICSIIFTVPFKNCTELWSKHSVGLVHKKKTNEFVKNNCIYVDRKNTPTIFRWFCCVRSLLLTQLARDCGSNNKRRDVREAIVI